MIKYLQIFIALISFLLSNLSLALTPSLPTEVSACILFNQNQPMLTNSSDKTIINFMQFLEREPQKEFYFDIRSKSSSQYNSSNDLNSYLETQNLQFEQNKVLLKTIHNQFKNNSTLKYSTFKFSPGSGWRYPSNKCDMEIRVNSNAAESLCKLTSLSTSTPSFMNTSCLIECDSENCRIK